MPSVDIRIQHKNADSRGGLIRPGYELTSVPRGMVIVVRKPEAVSVGFIWLLLLVIGSSPAGAQTFSSRSVAWENQIAPGTEGGRFSFFFDTPDVNDREEVVFSAAVAGGTSPYGVFLVSNGTLSPIALAEQPVPGAAQAAFATFGEVQINNAGDIAFTATVRNGSSLNEGIFLFSKGQIQSLGASFAKPAGLSLNDLGEIAFSAEPPVGGGRRVFLVSGLSTRAITAPFSGDPSLNNRGEIAFARFQEQAAPSPPTGEGISLYAQGRSQDLTTTGREPDINDSGEIVFVDRVGIHLLQGTSLSTLVAPSSLGPPRINNERSVAFAEKARPGPIGGPQPSDDTPYGGLGLYDGSILRLTSGESAGLDDLRFYGFGPPSLNNFGTLAFTATLLGAGRASRGVFVTSVAQNEKLYFPQFMNRTEGETTLTSQIRLINLSRTVRSRVLVEVNDDSGKPMVISLNDTLVQGRLAALIPPGGMITLKSSGVGPLQSGSATVRSSQPLWGVILLDGPLGTEAISESIPAKEFLAQVESVPGVNTALALMALEQDQTIQLELRSERGITVARGSVRLPAKGHWSRFITEIPWDSSPDVSNFSGVIAATGVAPFAASIVRVTPSGLGALSAERK